MHDYAMNFLILREQQVRQTLDSSPIGKDGEAPPMGHIAGDKKLASDLACSPPPASGNADGMR